MADVTTDTGYLRHIVKSIENMDIIALGHISDQLKVAILKEESEVKTALDNSILASKSVIY